MICECKSEVLCKECYGEHSGMDHKKVFFSDIKNTFPQMLSKKITAVDDFHKNYKNTESGRMFDAYVDFYEKCKEAALQLREHYDKQEPWARQTPQLAKFTEGKQELYELKDRYNRIRVKEDRDYVDFYRTYVKANNSIDNSMGSL
jgi:hypothetical protein